MTLKKQYTSFTSRRGALIVEVVEKTRLKGFGWIISFPSYMVKTFEDYRRLFRRGGKIDRRLLEDLKVKGIVEDFAEINNLVVTAGKQYIGDLMIAAVSGSFTHCAVGSGTNTPTAGDTTLQTQTDRITVTDRYRSGADVHFDSFFDHNSTANGTTINETGVFTAASGGSMYNRSIVTPGIAKTSSNTVTIAITGQWS